MNTYFETLSGNYGVRIDKMNYYFNEMLEYLGFDNWMYPVVENKICASVFRGVDILDLVTRQIIANLPINKMDAYECLRNESIPGSVWERVHEHVEKMSITVGAPEIVSKVNTEFPVASYWWSEILWIKLKNGIILRILEGKLIEVIGLRSVGRGVYGRIRKFFENKNSLSYMVGRWVDKVPRGYQMHRGCDLSTRKVDWVDNTGYSGQTIY